MFVQTQVAQSVYAISPRSHHTHIDLCTDARPNTSRSECICDLTAFPPHSYRSVLTCSTTQVAQSAYAISPRSHHTHIDLCSQSRTNTSRSECICDLTAHPPHSYRSVLTCSTTNVAQSVYAISPRSHHLHIDLCSHVRANTSRSECICDLTAFPPHSYRSVLTCSTTNVAQSVYAISPCTHHTHIDLCPHVRPRTVAHCSPRQCVYAISL